MINILNPPKYKIINVQESDDGYRIEVEVAEPLLCCPPCGCKAHLYKHAKRRQLIMDLPMHAKRVGIQVIHQRYKSCECGHTFYERLPLCANNHETPTPLEIIPKSFVSRTLGKTARNSGFPLKHFGIIF